MSKLWQSSKLKRLLLLFPVIVFVLYLSFESGRHFPSINVVVSHLRDNPQLLIEHPELVEAARSLAISKREEERRKKRINSLLSKEEFLLNASLATATENKKPILDIIEFVDYQCPTCRYNYSALFRAQGADPGLRIIYQMLPVFGIHSELAARMALAAKLQGKFEDFHKHTLYTNRPIDQAFLHSVASKIGLDMKRLEADIHSDLVKEHLKLSKELAEIIGITTVPTLVLNGKLLTGVINDEKLQSELLHAREAPIIISNLK